MSLSQCTNILDLILKLLTKVKIFTEAVEESPEEAEVAEVEVEEEVEEVMVMVTLQIEKISKLSMKRTLISFSDPKTSSLLSNINTNLLKLSKIIQNKKSYYFTSVDFSGIIFL